VSASEQLRPDVAGARDAFFASQLAGVASSDVVVVDESYATTQMARLRGRGPRGVRVVGRVPQGHGSTELAEVWKLLTILAAVTVHGVLAAATVDAATDGDVFTTFVREVLVPALRPGRVVVMDNLAAHKVAGVRRLVEAAGCRLVYLPPYSPDLSPIEPMWSKLKQALRTAGARAAAALGEAIDAALLTITAADCEGYFRHCGYTLHLK
jgi:transposase